VNVAEDFEELLSDKMPDLAQQFVQSKRSLLENAFTEFVNIEFFVQFLIDSLKYSVRIWNHVLQILSIR
jgi:hypothetical protein